MKSTADILKEAKKAAGELFYLTSDRKNAALLSMAKSLENGTDEILSANAEDVKNAEGKLSAVMIDRLLLNKERVKAMADGVRALVSLEDPVGVVLEEKVTPRGLDIKKISVPVGVVAIIYESRPNVTSDAAALCLKSGNVCVLRSGKEAYKSAHTIVRFLKKGLENCGENPELIQITEDISRASATELMEAKGYVDLLIPRGGAGLIKACVENAKVPVIETGTGICHVYVDNSADIEKAVKIVENAKASRPSVCNAEEVLLVDKLIAGTILPLIDEKLYTERKNRGLSPVVFKCDDYSLSFMPHGEKAGEKDFDTEFLDYILAVKTVDGVKEAVKHIAEHSTHHSEAIISENAENTAYFVSAVDSAAVYVNASTRFTDGGEFGLGCEMGISTQKLHARGPMGLKELTSYKYVIIGNGQIR